MDKITDEIEQLQNKILELENLKKQKEIDEENAKKGTFYYYFENLFDFIQMKNDVVNEEINRRIGPKEENHIKYSSHITEIKKKHGAELVPALEHIYNALDIINKRLTKLEN
uniref:Uncharacterized protein n=1 Tax=viral metagenome TaxID=1070528 RepID=A0A6C0HZ10_9ZZZZ